MHERHEPVAGHEGLHQRPLLHVPQVQQRKRRHHRAQLRSTQTPATTGGSAAATSGATLRHGGAGGWFAAARLTVGSAAAALAPAAASSAVPAAPGGGGGAAGVAAPPPPAAGAAGVSSAAQLLRTSSTSGKKSSRRASSSPTSRPSASLTAAPLPSRHSDVRRCTRRAGGQCTVPLHRRGHVGSASRKYCTQIEPTAARTHNFKRLSDFIYLFLFLSGHLGLQVSHEGLESVADESKAVCQLPRRNSHTTAGTAPSATKAQSFNMKREMRAGIGKAASPVVHGSTPQGHCAQPHGCWCNHTIYACCCSSDNSITNNRQRGRMRELSPGEALAGPLVHLAALDAWVSVRGACARAHARAPTISGGSGKCSRSTGFSVRRLCCQGVELPQLPVRRSTAFRAMAPLCPRAFTYGWPVKTSYHLMFSEFS